MSLTIDRVSVFLSSVCVACLLATCVHIGSLAKLSFSFCTWSVLAFLQMVDAINGKVTSSMVIILALKSIAIPNSFMV